MRCRARHRRRRRHRLRDAERRIAGVPAAAHRARRNAAGRRPLALSRDPGRRRSSWAWQTKPEILARENRPISSIFGRPQAARSPPFSNADQSPGAGHWPRSSLSPGSESVQEVRVAGSDGLSFRCGGAAMTIGELNLLDRTSVRQGPGLGLRSIPPGWPSARGHRDRFASLDALHAAMTDQVERATFAETTRSAARASRSRHARASEPGLHRGAGRRGSGQLDAERVRATPTPERRLSREVRISLSVRGEGKHQARRVCTRFKREWKSTPEDEFREALRQVYRIARFRLEELIDIVMATICERLEAELLRQGRRHRLPSAIATAKPLRAQVRSSARTSRC